MTSRDILQTATLWPHDISMAQDPIDVDELPQNIPRSPPKRRKLHPPKAPSPPIVISDDSDEDIEEVAAKLARKTATSTEVEFVAHIINLVSDEEDDSRSKTSAASTSAPRAQTKVRPVASSSKTPLPRLPDIKPIIKKSRSVLVQTASGHEIILILIPCRSPSVWQGSGVNNSNPHDRLRRSDPSNPRINKGPPSSILPIPPPRAEKIKGQRKADSDEEDYELTMGFDVVYNTSLRDPHSALNSMFLIAVPAPNSRRRTSPVPS